MHSSIFSPSGEIDIFASRQIRYIPAYGADSICYASLLAPQGMHAALRSRVLFNCEGSYPPPRAPPCKLAGMHIERRHAARITPTQEVHI